MNLLTKDTNIKIYGFMAKNLKLKGNECFIYAIIFNFSTGGNMFISTIKELADYTGLSTKCVSKNLKLLESKGLLEKIEIFSDGIKCYGFKAICTKEMMEG